MRTLVVHLVLVVNDNITEFTMYAGVLENLPWMYLAWGWSVRSVSLVTFTPNSLVIEPPSQTCPVSLGLRVLVMSYCLNCYDIIISIGHEVNVSQNI